MKMAQKRLEYRVHAKKWKHASGRITQRKYSILSRTWQQRDMVNLQPCKTSWGSVSQRRMRVLLRHLQQWDWRGPNSTWLPTDTRWKASPYFTRRGGSSSQSGEDGKVSRRGKHTSRTSPSRRRSRPDLTSICNKIWKTGEWPTTWTQSLPKKGNLELCQNYRTISLISHLSKVRLKIILNRLQPQAEEIIAEEQASLRAVRSNKEQLFNLRILYEKCRISTMPS